MNKTNYNGKKKSGNPNFRKSVDSEVRKFEGELRPLMTEEERWNMLRRNHESREHSFAGITDPGIHGITESLKGGT